MNILVTGASGLVGTALVSSLTSSGHEVTRLVRGQPKPGEKAAALGADGGKHRCQCP